MLQLGEPCKYDDTCQSNRCLDRQCSKDTEPSHWTWIGTALGIAVLFVIIVAILVTIFVRRKSDKYLNIRRF